MKTPIRINKIRPLILIIDILLEAWAQALLFDVLKISKIKDLNPFPFAPRFCVLKVIRIKPMSLAVTFSTKFRQN